MLIGESAVLVEDGSGGKIFIHSQLCWVWDAGQENLRRLAAVQLVEVGAARVNDVAAGFGVTPESIRRWRKSIKKTGVTSLSPVRKGPKGPRVLTAEKVAEIRRLRAAGGASLRATAAAAGVSTHTVRRALSAHEAASSESGATTDEAPAGSTQPVLPLLPEPISRSVERVAAWTELLESPAPVFVSSARLPLAGLFLALPALEQTGLLDCVKRTFGDLPGRYGMETIVLNAVLRAMAGEHRAEGATWIDPAALGLVLGMAQTPKLETIRRRIGSLATTGKAGDLLAALAIHHLYGRSGERAGDDGQMGELTAVLYVDGHVRAYRGGKKAGEVHPTRLKFPVPAAEETWVSKSHGSPVLVVMAKPGPGVSHELRALLPQLRIMVGDSRRIMVAFDRGGWSPALLKHMEEAGCEVFTWRKGPVADLPEDTFIEITHVDSHRQTRTWKAADTFVDLSLPTTAKEAFRMRQVSLLVSASGGKTRQIHILTNDARMPADEVIYRMESRWRQENYFRYTRLHFDPGSHDAHANSEDDPERTVPNPEKEDAYQNLVRARAHYTQVLAEADAALIAVRSTNRGTRPARINKATPNADNPGVLAAEAALEQAEAAHKTIPPRLSVGTLLPGQHVLATESKLISHAIRMAAFNTATTLAREIRTNTGYARSRQEAHHVARQALTGSGDIDTTRPGYLTIRLDPLPTPRVTAAISELCHNLTSTGTCYPGTGLILRYEMKSRT